MLGNYDKPHYFRRSANERFTDCIKCSRPPDDPIHLPAEPPPVEHAPTVITNPLNRPKRDRPPPRQQPRVKGRTGRGNRTTEEQRKAALDIFQRGGLIREAALAVGVASSVAGKWRKQWEQEGKL